MAKRRPVQKNFKHTWFLREWMAQSSPPKIQADFVKDLGWSKAKANDVYHGQQYTQALIDELAPWLNVRAWELLMHPEDAMAIRRLRDAAARIVADNARDQDRTGTDG